jgi:hypothetical protein
MVIIQGLPLALRSPFKKYRNKKKIGESLISSTSKMWGWVCGLMHSSLSYASARNWELTNKFCLKYMPPNFNGSSETIYGIGWKVHLWP